MLKDSSIKYE